MSEHTRESVCLRRGVMDSSLRQSRWTLVSGREAGKARLGWMERGIRHRPDHPPTVPERMREGGWGRRCSFSCSRQHDDDDDDNETTERHCHHTSRPYSPTDTS